MKKTMIVGNWKEHETLHEASILLHRLNQNIKVHRNLEIVLAPNMLALQPLSLQIDRRKFKLAAQNAYFKDSGAYTGEVSFTMLRGLVEYTIVGHSERRQYFNETLEIVRDKVQAAIRNGIAPILCVGENKSERNAGETRRVIHDQVTTALSNLTPEEMEQVVIAYEPVWAIGTGEPESPDDVQKVIAWIRHLVHDLYGATVAESQRVIYGASVEPEFVSGLLAIEGLDGFLVGGASLNYHKFAAIIDNAYQFVHQDQED
jgi:triosephosphate isomerase